MSGKDDGRFIKQFTKCREAEGASLTVHLAESRIGRSRMGRTLCNDDYRALVPMPDSALPFDPARDLAGICPNCRRVYEARARQWIGAPVEGRLVF